MPGECYRRTLVVRTAEGRKATLIVTRQSGHRDGPVWLSLGSTVATTIALRDADVGELTGLLTEMLQAAYDVDTTAPGRTKAPRPAEAERGA